MNKPMIEREILDALARRGSSSVRIVTRTIQEDRKVAGQVWTPLSTATVRNRLLDMEVRGLTRRENSGPGERHWWMAVQP